MLHITSNRSWIQWQLLKNRIVLTTCRYSEHQYHAEPVHDWLEKWEEKKRAQNVFNLIAKISPVSEMWSIYSDMYGFRIGQMVIRNVGCDLKIIWGEFFFFSFGKMEMMWANFRNWVLLLVSWLKDHLSYLREGIHLIITLECHFKLCCYVGCIKYLERYNLFS